MKQRLLTYLAAASTVLLAGCGRPAPPAAVPAPDGRFEDAAAASGIRSALGHGSPAGLTILDTIGHGCAWIEAYGDHRPAALLVTDRGCRLFRNDGHGHFTDVTASAFAPVPTDATRLLGCTVCDYDGDGLPDIFVTGYGRTLLYHNEGGGKFRDVTAGSGLEARGPADWTTSACWADVDGDGLPDLYVGRYVRFTPADPPLCARPAASGGTVSVACPPASYKTEIGSLYKNLGNGRFRDITAQAGLAGAHGGALGCLFADLDGSGRASLIIANDQQPADLFVSTGRAHFRSAGVEAGIAYGANGSLASGMGIDVGDYDGDGLPDILAADFSGQPKSLFHNEGGGRFINRAYETGFGAPSTASLSFGALLVDTMNSGRPDIVLTNGHVAGEIDRIDPDQRYRQPTGLYLNKNGRFEPAGAKAGTGFAKPIVGRGIAAADCDASGRLSLLISDEEGPALLLKNRERTAGNWLEIDCIASTPGATTLGATVTLRAGSLRMRGEVRAGGSYLSSGWQTLHFGLGDAQAIDSARIRWPGGKTSAIAKLAVNHRYTVDARGRATLIY